MRAEFISTVIDGAMRGDILEWGVAVAVANRRHLHAAALAGEHLRRAGAELRLDAHGLDLRGDRARPDALRSPRRAPGIRPDVIRLFAAFNAGLMVVDLVLARLSFRWMTRGYRTLMTVCILSETLAATVWIQMTGTVSSYFLIVGLMLIALYRLLWDYASGLTCALAMATFHSAAFALETAGVLRPASLFVSAPLGIYETPLFRAAAMVSLLVGYALMFLTMNFFASALREREAALRTARRDLARVVDETRSQGRLCGAVIAGRYELYELLGRGGMGEVLQRRSHRRRARRRREGLAPAPRVPPRDAGTLPP